jgi:hypothetical protein
MRIKMFETFNSEDYYTKISARDFIQIPIIDITDRTVSKLVGLGLDVVKRESPPVMTSDGIRRIESAYGMINDDLIAIMECDDEYFLVQPPGGGFYKCDQWDGLVRFLKDNRFIRKYSYE